MVVVFLSPAVSELALCVSTPRRVCAPPRAALLPATSRRRLAAATPLRVPPPILHASPPLAALWLATPALRVSRRRRARRQPNVSLSHARDELHGSQSSSSIKAVSSPVFVSRCDRRRLPFVRCVAFELEKGGDALSPCWWCGRVCSPFH